jgi:hypothetical protein
MSRWSVGWRSGAAVTLLAAGATMLAACGDDDGETQAQGADSPGYVAVSDVSQHAAIGGDIAAIKAELEAAAEGGVDWEAVERHFAQGGSSTKGDGSTRTLAALVEAPEHVAFVEAAIRGDDPASQASDAVRAQQVDKGISVLLAAKVFDELDAARAKIEAGDLEPETGAPHNVDEAWAFFHADGSGLASTADKRAADFGLEGKVREPVEKALADAQQAALEGDLDDFDAAVAEVRAALNGIFYLATYKYLDTQGDPVRRAEGLAFYRGIQDAVQAHDPAADEAIVTAFEGDLTGAGRAALNKADLLDALGVDGDLRQP